MTFIATKDPNRYRAPGLPFGVVSQPVAAQRPVVNLPGLNAGVPGRPTTAAASTATPGAQTVAALAAKFMADHRPPNVPKAAVAAKPSPLASAVSAKLLAGINGGGPYTASVIQQMDDDLIRASKGTVAGGRRQIDSDAARRGLFRSGAPVNAGMDLERGAAADLSTGMRKVRSDAALANAQQQNQYLQLGIQQNQYEQQRADEKAAQAAARAGGGGSREQMVTLTNPDGTTREVPISVMNQLTNLAPSALPEGLSYDNPYEKAG